MWKIFKKRILEGDDFVKKLIEIVKKEKIKIEQLQGSNTLFIVDNFKYLPTIDSNGCFLEIYDNDELKSKIKISKRYYYCFYKEQQQQEKNQFINNLPDLSEVGRNAKKYNL